jgi:hypothetical protein
MIESNLRAHLLAQATITALVSQRIYPLKLPQGATLPAITYQTIFGVPAVSHDGDADIGRRRIQIDCWSRSYAESLNIASAVRAATSGYRGPMGSDPYVNARVITEMDMPEPELSIWRRMIEVQLWHQGAA